MRIAVDTNVLVGAIQTFDPGNRATARKALKLLREQSSELLCFPQNFVEFWTVSTRPASSNGLSFSPEQSAKYLERFDSLFHLLPETDEIFGIWRTLVRDYKVSGVKAYDARVVAAMKVHHVHNILTFDLDDFNRYDGIRVIHPSSVQ